MTDGDAPPLTAADIVLRAKDPTATLPSSTPHALLLSFLSSPPPSIPVTAYLSSLLTLLSRSPPSPSLLSSLLLSFLSLFNSRRLPRDKNTAQIFHLLPPLLPSLDKSHLPAILDLITADLGEVSDPDDLLPLDLLPSLLDPESSRPIVDKLLSIQWSKALLLKIVSLLRELPDFARVRVSDFLEKIFDGMRGVEIQDLPSLVYQLLVLASKGFGRRAVVSGILGFFGGSRKAAAAVVRQVEGTVLMHVNFAVKQDPALGQEVLAIVRSDLGVVNHFAVAVVLSIARVRRFNESSIGVLKSAVVGSQRDYKVSRDCKWLPDELKNECLETAKCVEKALIRAINESIGGREHVVPSIVQFGFVLLECADGENNGSLGSSEELMSVEELGVQILKTLFDIHDMARNEIIEQCKFRILSLKPLQSTAITKLLGYLVHNYPYAVLEYVPRMKELLDYFTFMHERTSIGLIKAILPLIKFSHDLQDYIILVVRKAMFRREDSVRIAATTAIIELILVENRSKKNGPNSLQESSSQASCSQQADVACEMREDLFQELSGLLRRCLMQQARVKEIVYQGLMKHVLLDPLVAGPVFDFLWPHFLHFYSEDAEYCLRLDSCFKLETGKACLVEPLDSLLSCISWILLLQPHGKSDRPSQRSWACFGFSISQENEVGKPSSGELFSNAVSKIRKSLIKHRLEDGPGQSQAPSSHPPQREMTHTHGLILLGVIEVFINTIASELEKSTNERKGILEKEIMELVGFYTSIEKEVDSSRQRTGIRKGSSRTVQDIPFKADNESKECHIASLPKLSQTRKSFFTTSSIHQLLMIAVNSYSAANLSDQTVSQNHTQSSLCKKLDRWLELSSFVLKACLRHLKSVEMESGKADDPLSTLIYGSVGKLGRPIMQLVWLLRSGSNPTKNPKQKETKGKRNIENKGGQLFLSLSCLNEIFKTNSSRVRLTELVEDLSSWASSELDQENMADASEGINDEQELLIDNHYERRMHLLLEKAMKSLYAGLVARSFFRELEVLSELILTIGKTLLHEQRKSHGTWAVRICRSRRVENPSAAQSIVALAIYLMPSPDDLIVAYDMASELLKVMGSEEKDPIGISETFPVINLSTKNAIATMLMQLAETSIADLSWAISKLKAVSTFHHEFTSFKRNMQVGGKQPGLLLEEAIYSRSEALVYLLSSFTEMNLKDSLAEQLLKLTARFFKLLSQMTKLRIAPKGCKQFLPGEKFQKLAEVTCKKLTSPLYNFVALFQRNQQENAQSRGIVNKIKRESRCIPDLIFQIEDYERYLIQLSKLTKVNLLRHAKRSTARDFKILETKKMITPDQEPNQANSPSPENESEDESEDLQEENESEKVVSPESSAAAAAAADSESEKDDHDMVVKKKRAKMSKVVQDSDEET